YQNVEVVWRTRESLVAVIKRFLEVAGVLVILRDLPIAVSHSRWIARELLQKVSVHSQLFLLIRLIGDGLQSFVLWGASGDHDLVELSMRANGENSQTEQRGNAFHISPPRRRIDGRQREC